MINPLVSIIIPTHRPHYFKKALACALSQTYENKEIIVFDNSESDEIRAMSEQADGVLYHKNLDGSPLTNISAGIGVAKGEFIKYIFDDDLIFPHTIQSMIGAASRYNIDSVGMVTSYRHIIDGEDCVTGTKRILNIESPSLLDGREVIKLMVMNVSNFIGEFSTVLFNKRFLPVHAPREMFTLFGEDFPLGLVDVPLYVSILKSTQLLYMPYELSAFRKHETGGSNIKVNPNFHFAVTDWIRLIELAIINDLISKEDARVAVLNYEKLSEQFLDIYPKEILTFRSKADSLRREMEL